MEPKTIVAIVLIAFIIGGFIFLQVRKKTRSEPIIQGAEQNSALSLSQGGTHEPSQKD